MRPRPATLLAGLIMLAGVAGGAVWWRHAASVDRAAGPEAAGEPVAEALPVPPLPPRLTDDDAYHRCMDMIAVDPEGAEATAAAMRLTGGGDAALHCQALAAIAGGKSAAGARMLEALAHGGEIAPMTRAILLNQAAEARSMADQPAEALTDVGEALAILPDDPDLLIERANAYDALDRGEEALNDLNQALRRDPAREDALVLRASFERRLDRLDAARVDIEKAILIDPDDAEALLERGILRQRRGDPEGARRDWTRARDVDPTSEAAELAAQNLTLLDSGPVRK